MVSKNTLKIVVSGKVISETINETTTLQKQMFDAVDAGMSEIVAKALGFSPELVMPSDGQYGRSLPDGNWTGMIGMIQRQEVDLSICLMGLTEERSKAVPFSYPFTNSEVTFISRKPEYSPNMRTFLFPFSLGVWISFGVCLFIVPAIFYGLQKGRYSFPRLLLSSVAPFLGQSWEVQAVKFGDYMLIFSWVLGLTFLSNMYTAVLLSFMSFPPLSGVRTIQELSTAVSDGKYQCITYPGGFITMVLLSSLDPDLKVIGQNLQQNEGSNDIESAIETTIDNKKTVFVGPMVLFAPLKNRYFVSKDIFFSASAAIAVRKDFCCKSKLDQIMFQFWAAGLYGKILSDTGFLKSLKKNLDFVDVTKRERQLTISDYKGPFLFLIVFHGLAILVFIVECIVGKCQGSRVREGWKQRSKTNKQKERKSVLYPRGVSRDQLVA